MMMHPRLPHQPPIIVFGMHRSGTTLFTHILSDLGVSAGPRVSPNFEDVNFQEINRRLLASVGAHWANPAPFVSRLEEDNFVDQKAEYARSLLAEISAEYDTIAPDQLWAWKDPRNALTLPVWLRLFPEARAIHIVRNGIEVALSLQRRELRRFFRSTRDKRMFPPTIVRAYRLWWYYVETGISWKPRCRFWWQLDFFELCKNPVQQLEALCREMPIELPAEKFSQVTPQIRETTTASRFEKWWTQLLWNWNVLDHRPMTELGYSASHS